MKPSIDLETVNQNEESPEWYASLSGEKQGGEWGATPEQAVGALLGKIRAALGVASGDGRGEAKE